jgi:hypothetical protein
VVEYPDVIDSHLLRGVEGGAVDVRRLSSWAAASQVSQCPLFGVELNAIIFTP